MEKNRINGKGIGKNVLITYFNDDEKLVTAFVQIVDMSNFVTFKTKENLIMIPFSRVLKIKEKLR